MIEWRKHITQMTDSEKILLKKNILNGKKYELTRHAIARKREKLISDLEIAKCIMHGVIVEFHFVDDKKRVLIRGEQSEYGYNICVVFDIDTHTIVTVYKNYDSDNHSTLREGEYDSNYNLLDYVK